MHSPAPELPADARWLNVERPLDLRHDLSGHVALLAFLAPSCVHSRHAAAVLDFLDLRFPGRPFAVVGVCSPRLPAERDVERSVTAVDEAGWRFPLVIDHELAAWRAYGCRAWPTVVLVDGTGRIRFQGSGEPDRVRLETAITTLLEEVEYGGYGYAQPEVARAAPQPRPEGLAYPTGLAHDPARGELWVADTGHHRLVVVDPTSGRVLRIVGSGQPGAGDGPAALASFHAPRGVFVDGDRILVADTGNHSLRAVDADGAVTTLAGTGRRGRDRVGGRLAAETDLASPSAVAGTAEELWVAVTGAHQIWRMERATGRMQAAFGNGAEHRRDGFGTTAVLAQPRGIVGLAGSDDLAFVDAGSHAVRLAKAEGEVVTLLAAPSPFAAGDADGPLATALLQEPAAVVAWRDALIVADSGNDKLRRLDRQAAEVSSVPGLPPLSRPQGLACVGEALAVADTGHHRLLLVEADGTAREVSLEWPAETPAEDATLRLRNHADCTLKLPLPLPAGARLHPQLPVRVHLRNVEGAALMVDLAYDAVVTDDLVEVRGVATTAAGQGVIAVEVDYGTCHDPDAVVHRQRLARLVTLVLADDAPTQANAALASCRPAPAR